MFLRVNHLHCERSCAESWLSSVSYGVACCVMRPTLVILVANQNLTLYVRFISGLQDNNTKIILCIYMSIYLYLKIIFYYLLIIMIEICK